jgi:hypothetical protein
MQSIYLRVAPKAKLAGSRVTGLGEFSPHGVFFCEYFLELRTNFWGYFFTEKLGINLTMNGLGYILVDFFFSKSSGHPGEDLAFWGLHSKFVAFGNSLLSQKRGGGVTQWSLQSLWDHKIMGSNPSVEKDVFQISLVKSKRQEIPNLSIS